LQQHPITLKLTEIDGPECALEGLIEKKEDIASHVLMYAWR